MKIFSWVHRRFNNNKGENAKKNGDDDKQFEGEKKSNDVFESWGGGILTIGTFGYDPLKDESHEQMEDVLNDFLYEENAVLANYESHDEDSDDEEEVEINADDEEEEGEEKPLVFGGYFEDLIESEEFGFEYMMMEKRARTTLADLFSADHSEDTMKKQPLKKGEFNVKEKHKTKTGASFTKKLKLEEARPIHKLNQLMRRMLKRKIHPVIGVVNSKVKKCVINDHASLLPTPDAIM